MRFRLTRNLTVALPEFAVLDENGRVAFLVSGRAVGPGDRLCFHDARRREVAYVRRRNPSGGPAWEIVYADEPHAVLRKDGVSPTRATFAMDLPGPDDLEARGDIPGCEYVFVRDGRTVATVSRAGIAGPDAYGVDVGKGEDEVLILASAVVLDLCCREEDGTPAAGAGG